MAEHFQKQIRSWGIAPSYAFVGEPQTNGVIERFFRTFKEQVVHGRIYQTIDDVRDAVRTFAVRYNADWLIEKNGLRSPNPHFSPNQVHWGTNSERIVLQPRFFSNP